MESYFFLLSDNNCCGVFIMEQYDTLMSGAIDSSF